MGTNIRQPRHEQELKQPAPANKSVHEPAEEARRRAGFFLIYAIYSVVNNKHYATRCYCACGEKNIYKKLENHICRVYSRMQTLHV